MAISRKSHAIVFALIVLCLGIRPMYAQEPGSVPEQSQQSASSPASESARADEKVAKENQKGAEEEEQDDTAKFKHSAAVQLIGRILGLDSQRSYWIAVIINFSVIAIVIGWAGRKALPDMFRDRTASIQKAMQEAQKASAEARAKLGEIESRLAKLDSEIASIRDSAEREAGAEEGRIKAAAEEDARKIVAAAEQEIAAAAKAARRQLTSHAAELAVNLAQKQIKVDAGTDQNLIRNFAGQLGSESSGKDRN